MCGTVATAAIDDGDSLVAMVSVATPQSDAISGVVNGGDGDR